MFDLSKDLSLLQENHEPTGAQQKSHSGTEKDRRSLDKRIWRLTLPALIELLLATLFGMVDMVMVGNVSTEALTAVGLANQPIMFAISLFQALGTGTMALVAHFTGTKERQAASLVLRQTILLGLFSGTLISILGIVLAEDIVVFMGAEPEVVGPGTSYFKTVAAGLLFVSVVMGIGAALRGSGDTVTPMRYNLISNLLNVIGNYVLIYGKLGFPALGVTGAALSTTISRGLAMSMALYAVTRPNAHLSLTAQRTAWLDLSLIKRILRIGFPAGLEQVALRTGIIEFARTVATLGTNVFAAHQIAINVISLSFAPAQAFGMAATTLVGQSLGAKEIDQAERAGLETRRLGILVAVPLAIVFFFCGYQIASLYTNDTEVAKLAAGPLKIVAIMQPLQLTQFILAGALRGAGDTRWPLLSTFIGIWGIRVVLAKIFIGLGFGLIGAWAANFCDQLFRSIFITIRYNSKRWQRMRI
jgi:putative MATE family efflux protein